MSSDSPIDRSALDRLDLGDQPGEMLRTLIDAFLEHTPGLAAELADHTAAGDVDAAGAAAHSLKSSARMFGAVRLGDLCERVEVAAYDGALDADAAAEAAVEVVRVMDALRTLELG